MSSVHVREQGVWFEDASCLNTEGIPYSPYSDSQLKKIEKAGRLCYKSEHLATKESFASFIQKRIEDGHESIIEHSFLTFRYITNRAISHELVRHRLASFSQESQRYVRYSEGNERKKFQVIRPFKYFSWSAETQNEWLSTMEACFRTYSNLLNAGVQPQVARDVLPNATKTEIIISANLREWRHILALRMSKKAAPQMAQLMTATYSILYKYYPSVFYDFDNQYLSLKDVSMEL